MKILIDGDGCPVIDLTIKLAEEYHIECIILCDTSHMLNKENIKTIVVDKGLDSVDFALVNILKAGDIVITQDYGLAAMCLAKQGIPINQNGMIYHNGNIDSLLMQRHITKKIRMAGGKTKSIPKRTDQQNHDFYETLKKILES